MTVLTDDSDSLDSDPGEWLLFLLRIFFGRPFHLGARTNDKMIYNNDRLSASAVPSLITEMIAQKFMVLEFWVVKSIFTKDDASVWRRSCPSANGFDHSLAHVIRLVVPFQSL